MHGNRKCRTGRALTLAALSAVSLAAWAPSVFAAPAQVITTVHLRAGPSTDYPALVVLLAGTSLEVFGCEVDYVWCDVQAGTNRGWVAFSVRRLDCGLFAPTATSNARTRLAAISSCTWNASATGRS